MLDEIMLQPASQNLDLKMISSETEELNITKLFYLYLRKSIVDFDAEKLYEELKDNILKSYDDTMRSDSKVKSVQSKEALEKIIKKIDEDRKAREGYESRAEESEEDIERAREKEQETKFRIKETLKLYAEYFEIKLKGIGHLDSDFDKYIQNLTYSNKEFNNIGLGVRGSGLLSSILHDDSSGQIDKFLELEQVLEKYLLGLTIKTELQINFSEHNLLDQKYNASEIKNILAVFPGGYSITDNKQVVTDIDFACIAGTSERVKAGMSALNNGSVEENAIAGVLESQAVRFTKYNLEGLEIHLIPCIQLALATSIDDVSDPFAMAPQEKIRLREILDLIYNLNEIVKEEIDKSKKLITNKYEALLENPNPDEQKIKDFVGSMYNCGFIEKSDLPYGFLLVEGEYGNFISKKELEENYLKSPTERFKDRISRAAKDLPEHDYLKHILDPKQLFKKDNIYRLDVKKIKNLVDLFQPKIIDEAIDEEAQNEQKSKMLAGMVTLRNILDGYKEDSSKYFYFLKFDKKFKEKHGVSFTNFDIEEDKVLKKTHKEINGLITTLKIQFDELDEGKRLFIQQLIFDEENKDGIKKLCVSNPGIIKQNGIVETLYEVSEEALLVALEIEDSGIRQTLLEQITQKEGNFTILQIMTNNQGDFSFLQLMTFSKEKELLLKILKKYQEAHIKEGDDGKKALSEMIFEQELLFCSFFLNEDMGISEAIIPMMNIDNLNNIIGVYGNNPLHLACKLGHPKVAQALISEGVELNIVNNDGDTPLHMACKEGHLEVAQALIDAKADLNIVNNDGDTPLHIACKEGYLEVAQALIDAKADLNQVNKEGITPLHIACKKNDLEVTEALINSEGVDLNIANKEGNTPLHIACKEGHPKVAQVLIDSEGVDLNIANKEGITPLHIACEYGYLEVVKALINKSAELNKTDYDSKMDYSSDLDDMNELMATNIINAGELIRYGETPLHIACKKNYLEVAQALIIAGAELNIANKEGETPLEIAKKNNNHKIIQVLELKINKTPESDAQMRPEGGGRATQLGRNPKRQKGDDGPAGGIGI